ncbi:protein flightless-1 homolog [Sycon ciliatum]|uniref:protein flightless-1 homolog n=1 Tax=Sycon ciliatum TaxID=27933 RepID=UPI0020A918D5|eukprot:scpid22963/ scgid20066/ Protein flightless-1 homolog
MAQGVLAFVRGIDLTRNEFQERTVPEQFQDLGSLRWLRLNHSTLESLPPQIAKLKKLEHIHIAHNQMKELTNALVLLPRLRTINARYNELTDEGIPEQLFALDELSTVDFSHNALDNIPENLDDARGLQVLSLSNNQIKELPKALFVELNDLHHLDLSNNKLETIPPQLRRLHHLNTLNLANNPLAQSKLRALRHLNSLTVLNLSGTQRSMGNLPDTLHEGTPYLEELDLSHNSFTFVPQTVYELTKLRRVNFSHNQITELTAQIEVWIGLVTFNVCHNELKAIPNGICKLTELRRVFVSDNKLTFDGIPVGIGRLVNLEVFAAARNRLQCIPDGLCRCAHLRRLVLNNNELVTLPETIHFLKNLEALDLRHNPNLVMPPKPVTENNEAAAQFYNIDFDVEKLKRGETAIVKPNSSAASRKHRLLNKRKEPSVDNEAKASVLLQGMSRAHGASERHRGSLDIEPGSISLAQSRQGSLDSEDVEEVPSIKAKRWDETLERPNLNYEEIFSEDTGREEGLTIWSIENFVPVYQDPVFYGQFYEGDCYIVLKTFMGSSNSSEVDWEIFYWCGKDATMDKLACAAIHAVNLRNMLGARGRTMREEQADESPEFLDLFDNGDIMYIEGGSASGFYTQEDRRRTSRFYRMSGSKTLHFEAVPANVKALDAGYVFILDSHKELFVWSGKTSSLMCRQKSRLLAEKINKNDHKDQKTVTVFPKGEHNAAFLEALGWAEEDGEPEIEDKVGAFQPARTTLYRVVLGHGYLELPQVEQPNRRLEQKMLMPSDVYILDCTSDIFVWIGRKSARLVRAAALKLSAELCMMLPRRPQVMVSRVMEGTENLVFKSKFPGWDDVIGVDYTKIPGFGKVMPKLKISLEGTNQDKNKSKAGGGAAAAAPVAAAPELPKIDMSALFSNRVEDTPDDDAIASREDYNIDLAEIKCFVLENKKFVKLPPEEEGHCFSDCSYVFLCRYFVPLESNGDGDEEEEAYQEELATTVFFWQGHNAPQMGWLTFTFSFQKKIEQLIGNDLNVRQVFQQQESPRLLAHFDNKLIIHRGSRTAPRRKPTLFQMRCNGGLENTRTVEIDCTGCNLNSAYCYVLRVPFEPEGGIVYGWRGSTAHKYHCDLLEEVAKSLCDEGYAMQLIDEGEEPENFFWVGLGGKVPYITTATDYRKYMRLFRCSNERGFFSVSEKCADFCQGDLDDDDVMILDDGHTVFIWVGTHASDVESKLGAKSAQVYANYWGEKPAQRKRELKLVRKGKELDTFKSCFHGWVDWSHLRGRFPG